ncbi:MAG: hypothetical protein JW839_20210 [Candidatus Lokiarchaeota archaeon]|nr:hypothetical protein [Candidatus Lokiarchaeota archaeon]
MADHLTMGFNLYSFCTFLLISATVWFGSTYLLYATAKKWNSSYAFRRAIKGRG